MNDACSLMAICVLGKKEMDYAHDLQTHAQWLISSEQWWQFKGSLWLDNGTGDTI